MYFQNNFFDSRIFQSIFEIFNDKCPVTFYSVDGKSFTGIMAIKFTRDFFFFFSYTETDVTLIELFVKRKIWKRLALILTLKNGDTYGDNSFIYLKSFLHPLIQAWYNKLHREPLKQHWMPQKFRSCFFICEVKCWDIHRK